MIRRCALFLALIASASAFFQPAPVRMAQTVRAAEPVEDRKAFLTRTFGAAAVLAATVAPSPALAALGVAPQRQSMLPPKKKKGPSNLGKKGNVGSIMKK